MKAVILAGGFGTRISEESAVRPKPMVEIGGKPILWHIMKIYSAYGINDFVICLGYKGYIIKEYFANYFLHNADVTFDMRYNSLQIHQTSIEPWHVTLVDTGDKTMTGGRLKRVQKYVDNEPFCLTYGDGVANVDLKALIAYHHAQKTMATVTVVQPPGRYGVFNIRDQESLVDRFMEKPRHDGAHQAWISGGFFVLDPAVLDLIDGDQTVWEEGPMQQLVNDQQMAAYRHHGFWQSMDTLRDKNMLEELWQSPNPPWKVW